MTTSIADQLRELRAVSKLNQSELARLLGTSLIAIDRWERGDVQPSPTQAAYLEVILKRLRSGSPPSREKRVLQNGTFASQGSTRRALTSKTLSLFGSVPYVELNESPNGSILSRIKKGRFFGESELSLQKIRNVRGKPAATPSIASSGGISAGKNTYTYDAHTYHTKVPPQGIVEFINHYLPHGGVILDPFSGSGMTGVAARIAGADVILNELSPAACFISHNFTQTLDPALFAEGLKKILSTLQPLRERLYTTNCRECGKKTEILYTVWSYFVKCGECQVQFRLWDHCRKYGNSVKEHKILGGIL